MILFLLAGGVAVPSAAASARTVVRDDLQSVFQREGTKGTFVLYDVQAQRYTYVDLCRGRERAIPASTFKIVNTLIALETGAVSSVDEVIPWDRTPQPFPSWEHDMSMREAIKISNAGIYQQVARRVGLERMTGWVDRLGYGNERVGPVIDQFWLQGPLKISPEEQTRFLARLAQDRLPIGHTGELREIIQQEPGLYAKTGWQFEQKFGWWVGWFEQDGRLWTFALQMDLPTDAHAAKRVPIGRELLKTLGVPLP
ncbi:class D beta-lactamase [Lentzea tibetensis]|uniref:Beta-lactamase n=1 Tax=Lentzea tibetensis TaxID=2591470 RepID=A0A563EIV8_9PSEU|nr:class D beta-lactamase [Lentzea tibetensis]